MMFELVVELLSAILEIALTDRQRSQLSSLGSAELSKLFPQWLHMQ